MNWKLPLLALPFLLSPTLAPRALADGGASPTAEALAQALNKTSVGIYEGKMSCGEDSTDFTMLGDDTEKLAMGLDNYLALYLYSYWNPKALDITVQSGKQPEVIVRNYRRGGKLNEDHSVAQIGDVLVTGEFSTTAGDTKLAKVVLTTQTYVNVGTVAHPKAGLSADAEKITCKPYAF